MSADSPLPSLRQDLEIVPIEHEGKPMFLMRDHEGLSDPPVALSPSGMTIAILLNGSHTAGDLRALIAKQTGSLLNISEIQGLVSQLDKARLLETPEIQSERRKILEDFLADPRRKAVLKGAYPENTLELAGFLGKFFQDSRGPGKPLPDRPLQAAPPLGLISPHIDLQRGGPAYAWAYRALADSPPPDVIVSLGVAHAGPNSPWVMTQKAYETPYGPMAVDGDLYNDIAGRLWYDPRADEWVHRREHSLEFQALWLKFLWREKTPSWVPILCSSFERFCPDQAPSTVATVEDAINQIGARLAQKGKERRILILAGVDLAHVGRHFGDDLEITPELQKRIEDEDRKTLDHALRLEADPYYLSAIAGDHWRKICGLSALYTSLRWIKALGGDNPSRGRLLSYGQAPDPNGGVVSFASAIYPAAGALCRHRL